MLAAFGWYTTLVVCLYVIATGGGSNLFPEELFKSFSPKEIADRVRGSKIVIISEQAMLNTIYFLKACMLLMYTRLTMGLRQQRMVRAIAVYVGLGWVGTELAFFVACRPFTGYWAVPPPDPQCTTLRNFSIVQCCFNISSDILMLAIMLPLLLQVKLPLRQKIALVAVFSLGSFVIVAAILTKYFNLSDVYSTVYMNWYVREASTAIYVTNLPLIWPLLREWFPYLRKITPGYRSMSSSSKNGGGAPTTSMCGMRRTHRTTTAKESIHLSDISKTSTSTNAMVSQYPKRFEAGISRTASVERINKPAFGGHGILAETTVNIDIEPGSNSSADDLDLQVPARIHGTDHNRMSRGWDRSRVYTRADSHAIAHEVTITGGDEERGLSEKELRG